MRFSLERLAILVFHVDDLWRYGHLARYTAPTGRNVDCFKFFGYLAKTNECSVGCLVEWETLFKYCGFQNIRILRYMGTHSMLPRQHFPFHLSSTFMDRRWILALVQVAVCSAPGSKFCTNRWPMPASVNSTAPPLPSIFSPNTTAAGEDGIHRRGRHPEPQPSWLPVASPDFAIPLEDGIHRNGWHPERQPSWLPVTSPDFAAVS